MDLIRTGIGLSKTIKNAARLREILTVFSRNGFRSYIVSSGMGEEYASEGVTQEPDVTEEALHSEEGWALVGLRLRKSFEELGPSFVKLGQLLATREDILDPALIRELKKLQNQVKPISFAEAREAIETHLGAPLHTVFREIRERPIGTASIGVVYRGTLLSGEEVVIKVRRPGIEKTLQTDFEIVRFIVAQIEKVSEALRYLGLSRVLEDFFRATQSELNFLTEAQNCERLRTNLAKIDTAGDFVLPQVYRQYCGASVLVMEFLDGKPFNRYRSLDELGPTLIARLEKSVDLFAHTLLADGFFHADLHGGNFFILKDGRIGLIDFGLMGTLSKKNRANLIAVLYALVTHNYDNLVYEFLEVADYDRVPDHEELIRDIRDSLGPFVGLSVQETNVTDLVRAIISTLAKHRLYLPREWFIIFRALMTLDGVGKSVGLDLNIFKILEKDIPKLLGEVLTKENAQEEAMWIGKDLLTSLRIVPKHLKWFLREHAKRGYAFELRVQDAAAHVKTVARSVYFLGYILLSSIFILVGALPFIGRSPESFGQVPTMSWVFWAIAALVLVRATILKKY